jgi:MerR family mercuric resistance operon transcriptional regulator/MerR family copper efflux transcriptional regulator
MKIGQLARCAGITVDSIRFYERRGLLPRPQRQRSGYRIYGEATLRRIQWIKSLQTLGFTLDEVAGGLGAFDAGKASCQSERWRLEAVLTRLDGKIAELERVRGNVVEALGRCASGRCRFDA